MDFDVNLPRPLYYLACEGAVCLETREGEVLALFSTRREAEKYARGTFLTADLQLLVTARHLSELLGAVDVPLYAIDPPNQADVGFRVGSIETLSEYAQLVEEGRV